VHFHTSPTSHLLLLLLLLPSDPLLPLLLLLLLLLRLKGQPRQLSLLQLVQNPLATCPSSGVDASP
jgi:hypothetical protein